MDNIFHTSGTVYINAVFFGTKGETEKDKDGPSSSSPGIVSPTTTRKHILQVSTYQVSTSSFYEQVSISK